MVRAIRYLAVKYLRENPQQELEGLPIEIAVTASGDVASIDEYNSKVSESLGMCYVVQQKQSRQTCVGDEASCAGSQPDGRRGRRRRTDCSSPGTGHSHPVHSHGAARHDTDPCIAQYMQHNASYTCTV